MSMYLYVTVNIVLNLVPIIKPSVIILLSEFAKFNKFFRLLSTLNVWVSVQMLVRVKF